MQIIDGAPSLHRIGYVGIVTLRRPRRHNRLQPLDMEQIRTFLCELQDDAQIRAVVLRATGPSFSSGFDLSASTEAATGAGERAEVILQKLCDELEDFPLPTVCAINGGIYGGATDLALACDFRIGVAACKLRMPAAQLGVCFYPSGMRRYVSRLGLGTSKKLFMAGAQLTAAELERVGFLDSVVADAAELEAAVDTLTRHLVALPPIAAKHAKRSLNQAAHHELDHTAGDLAFRQSLNSTEFAHALKAWNQRKS